MSTYPTYHSPIRLLDELGVDLDDLSPKKLKLERKRLLLEVQLSEGQILEIGNQAFTKNDVLDRFNSIEEYSSDELGFHKAINRSKELLILMEEGTVEGKFGSLRKLKINVGDKLEAFTQFLSPHLTPALQKLMSESILNRNFLELDRIDAAFEFLTPEDARIVFKPFETFCLSLNERLNQIVHAMNKLAGTAIFPKGDTNFLHYRPFYNLANHVAQYYPKILDEIARTVLDFVVSTKGSLGEQHSQHQILSQARILRCSEELEKIILEKMKQFPSRHDLDRGSSFSAKSVLLTIGLIILTLVFLSRSCGNNNDNFHSRSLDEIQEKLEQMRESQSTSTPSVKKKPIGSNFNKTAFIELHRKVYNIVRKGQFSDQNFYASSPVPKVYSKFMKPESGKIQNINNETDSDVLIVVWTGTSLNSYFIESNSRGTFKANESSQFFLYAGKEWQTKESIRNILGVMTSIEFSGRFSESTQMEIDLLMRRYNLIGSVSNEFLFAQYSGEYDLFCTGDEVNYQY